MYNQACHQMEMLYFHYENSTLLGARWMDAWRNECMDEWVNGWMSEWVNEWMGEWVNGWMSEWVNGWVGGWVSGWMGEWMDGWMDNNNPFSQNKTYYHEQFSFSSKFILFWGCLNASPEEKITHNGYNPKRTQSSHEHPVINVLFGL